MDLEISELLDKLVTITDHAGTVLASGIPAAIQNASDTAVNSYNLRNVTVDTVVYALNVDPLIVGGLKLGNRLVYGGAVYKIEHIIRSNNEGVASDTLFKLGCLLRAT